MAATQPEQIVSVIVQKANASDQAERYVEELGGKITKDLHIINAFAARMSASQAKKLAGSSMVRWVSLDAPVENTGKPSPPTGTEPHNYFLGTLGVRKTWAMKVQGQYLIGQGIGVAVIDSGISLDPDFSATAYNKGSRLIKQISFSSNSQTVNDTYGHGTFVAGILGGNGSDSERLYLGVAPEVNLISLKISDETGMAYESDTVAAMQWVFENKSSYNIRVVNLSINSTVEQSYHTSPLDAAAEVLWFNGIVVIASAGNKGPAGTYNTVSAAPANDPFIITVGASDEKGTADRTDDVLAPFSARGITSDGFSKPEIVAPGTSIISVLSKLSPWDEQYPDRNVLNAEYFRLSGTSMAAPMVSGAVALLLQDEPNLTPDQVKYRLMQTGSPRSTTTAYLDVYAAVTGVTTESANIGLQASQLLWSGSDPITWTSVNWNSVNWNSVNWNSVNWNSVNWNSVNWNSVNWNN
jgi:serine protease AprX